MTANVSSELVAQKVRRALIERGLSQRGLARQTRIPIQRLNRRLCGETPFKIDEITEIAEALQMPVAELLEEEDQ